MPHLSDLEVLERIALALLAGCLVGFEREWHDKPAGIRTYALVCEGSALFMIASLKLGEQVTATGQGYDPGRIASTIVQGVGFLAGGVIFTHGARVKGLTTAAGIWVIAAVGMLIGMGAFFVASIAVATTIFTLVALSRFEHSVLRFESSRFGPSIRRRSPPVEADDEVSAESTPP